MTIVLMPVHSSCHVIKILCFYFVPRYAGTDTAIMTPIALPESAEMTSSTVADISACTQAFSACYSREYGFELQNRGILVDDLRVRCVGHNAPSMGEGTGYSPIDRAASLSTNPDPHAVASVYFEDGRLSTPIYLLHQFTDKAAAAGGSNHAANQVYFSVHGPAIIVQDVATVIVEPGCTADVSSTGNIEITVHTSGLRTISSTVMDPIYLSIFSHRFMGIAEQMGR